MISTTQKAIQNKSLTSLFFGKFMFSSNNSALKTSQQLIKVTNNNLNQQKGSQITPIHSHHNSQSLRAISGQYSKNMGLISNQQRLFSALEEQTKRVDPSSLRQKVNGIIGNKLEITTPPMKEFAELQPFAKYKLIKKENAGKNAIIFTFALRNPQSTFALPPGKFVLLRRQDVEDGEYSSKPYTPISRAGTVGSFEILVRLYEYGELTTYLGSLDVGDYCEIQGACGDTSYMGYGQFIREGVPLGSTKVNMISGGCGISPMLAVMQAIADDPTDKTQVSLLSCNATRDEILLEKELSVLTNQSKGQFVAAFPTADKDGDINMKMLKEHCHPGAVTLICGPPLMRRDVIEMLEALGHNQKDMIIFY